MNGSAGGDTSKAMGARGGAVIGFVRVLRVPGVRRRLLVTLCAVVLFRMGQHLPLPGVDVGARTDRLGGPGSLADLFTGGGLRPPAVFAFGVLPLYVASGITRCLTAVSPRLKSLSEDVSGGPGRIMRFTRCLTVFLSATVATALAATGHFFPDRGPLPTVALVACVTAGTGVVMRLAELITGQGLGYGTSVLFLTQVAAVFPGQLRSAGNGLVLVVVPVLFVIVAVAVITARQAERRIATQRAKRMVGRSYGGDAVHIPVRVDQAGYHPMVCASLMLYVPVWLWHPATAWYLPVCFVLVVLGMYVCAVRVLDVEEVSHDLRRKGMFIPGIRPGAATIDYLGYVRSRLAWCNALYSGVIVVLPMVALTLLGVGAGSPLSAPAVLIATGIGMTVSLEVTKQAESMLVMDTYAPYLR
jgi:preprotein translocase subunit SecY